MQDRNEGEVATATPVQLVLDLADLYGEVLEEVGPSASSELVAQEFVYAVVERARADALQYHEGALARQ